MSEYNETWRVVTVKDSDAFSVIDSEKETVCWKFYGKINQLDRAVLCVNACAGVPDKLVEEMPHRIKANKEVMQVTVEHLNKVEADLDEGVGLLKIRCADCKETIQWAKLDEVCEDCDTKAFLTRMEDKS